MSSVHELPLCALAAAVEDGSVGAREAVRQSIERIEAHDDDLNSFVALCTDAGDDVRVNGPLAGVPIGIKDVFVDRDRAPTMGSRVHATGLCGTATVVERLRAAGAVIVGYTNLHEWAVGTTSIETATGPIRNPWNIDHVAGGSSGGSAAALAAGFVAGAVGTDLGGSIRVPAACCGVVGLKPTWGLVPTRGYAGDGGDIDHVGPMARSVDDVAALLEVLAPGDYSRPDVSELVVGVASRYFFDDVEPVTGAVLEQAIGVLEKRAQKVVAVDVPSVDDTRFAIAAFALPFLAGLLGDALVERGDELRPETLQVLTLGVEMSDDERARGAAARDAIRAGWDDAFSKVDAVVTPTLPAPPALISEKTVALPSGIASADLSYIALNAPMNLGGVPCLTLPCGMTAEGWSVGASLTAPRGSDATVLAMGAALEESLDGAFANRVAPLDTHR
jgi:aspartyl-tRNA(Asn)/glutamyl-tRNA(Gln) amidotransferase subunit A